MKTAPARRRVDRLRSSVTRCLMVWVALISLLPMLSTYVHLLLVQHSTCPEHGEIIDQPAGQPAGQLAGQPAGQPTSADPSTLAQRQAAPTQPTWHSAESTDEHRHAHCTFVLSRRQVFVACVAISAYLAPPLEHPAPPAVQAERPPTRIAVLRLAPKQSPPA
jgi:hypothetical protein